MQKGEGMKMRVVVCLLALCAFALSAANLRAQDETPKVDLFAGYSYLQSNPSSANLDSFHLNGGSVSGAYNVTNWFGAVADFGAYTNGNIGRSGAGGTTSTYLFGPRVSYRHFRRVTPFGQVLFGVARTNASAFLTSGSQNAFAMTAGGGVDLRLTDRFALRPMQVEYLLTRFQETNVGNQTQNNLRVSTGLVFRF
jgi:opacity protein-like surface antigen